MSLQILIFLILVALAFDFLNGFHDAANSIATVVSTRVLSPQVAVIWAAFFNFVAAFVLGTHVAVNSIDRPDIDKWGAGYAGGDSGHAAVFAVALAMLALLGDPETNEQFEKLNAAPTELAERLKDPGIAAFIAKLRAARRIWAHVMRDRFKAKNPRSWMLRFHTQTAGVSLTAQQPYNNVVRTALQALAGVLLLVDDGRDAPLLQHLLDAARAGDLVAVHGPGDDQARAGLQRGETVDAQVLRGGVGCGHGAPILGSAGSGSHPRRAPHAPAEQAHGQDEDGKHDDAEQGQPPVHHEEHRADAQHQHHGQVGEYEQNDAFHGFP